MLELVDMGSEQDRGWTIKTECHFANLRGGSKSFYESRAVHPIYGETIPARSIDEDTAHQEMLARIGRMESQMGSMMPMVEMVEEVEAIGEVEAEAQVADTAPDAEMGTTTVAVPMQVQSSAMPNDMPDAMPIDAYPVTPPPALGDNEQENEQIVDPLAAEYGHNLIPLNFTRRVENGLANHRRIPKRRPTGHLMK